MRRSAFGSIITRDDRPGKFYARIRRGGREVTRYAGCDKKIAQRFLADLQRQYERSALLGDPMPSTMTFAKARKKIEDYCRDNHEATTSRSDMGRIRRILDHFGPRVIAEVTSGEVDTFIDELRAEKPHAKGAVVVAPPASPGSKNRYRSMLGLIYRLAVERGWATSSPVGKSKHREALKAIPFITDADVQALIDAADDVRMRWMIRFAADSGLRLDELCSLEWRDVDLRREVTTVRESKGKRPRDVPFSPDLLPVARAMSEARAATPLHGADPVWPDFIGKSGGVSKRFDRVAPKAGFPWMTFHDLRHAFCSRLAQRGVEIPTIQRLAGHKSIATTMRYAGHIPKGAEAAAMKKLGVGVTAGVTAGTATQGETSKAVTA